MRLAVLLQNSEVAHYIVGARTLQKRTAHG